MPQGPWNDIVDSPRSGLNSRDRSLAEQFAFTPEEKFANARQEQDLREYNLSELADALKTQKDPELRKVLLRQYNQILATPETAKPEPAAQPAPAAPAAALPQGKPMNDLMQLLNAMGLRRDTLGAQTGDRMLQQGVNMGAMRDRPEFARNQSMQNYLGPLEHQQFLQQAGPMGAAMGGAMSPAYGAAKAMAPGATNNAVGGGGPALQSQPGLEEIIRALQGAGQGIGAPSQPGAAPGMGAGAPQLPPMADMDPMKKMMMLQMLAQNGQ